jgi:hypothetical protein
MNYEFKAVGNKMFQISTQFNDEDVTFNVVVAEDESELDGLVEHHLAYLANPNPVAPVVQPSSVKSLEEHQTLIDTLMARLAALEAK